MGESHVPVQEDNPMFCERCGTPYSSSGMFCKRCGHPRFGDGNPTESGPTEEPVPETKPKASELKAAEVPVPSAPVRQSRQRDVHGFRAAPITVGVVLLVCLAAFLAVSKIRSMTATPTGTSASAEIMGTNIGMARGPEGLYYVDTNKGRVMLLPYDDAWPLSALGLAEGRLGEPVEFLLADSVEIALSDEGDRYAHLSFGRIARYGEDLVCQMHRWPDDAAAESSPLGYDDALIVRCNVRTHAVSKVYDYGMERPPGYGMNFMQVANDRIYAWDGEHIVSMNMDGSDRHTIADDNLAGADWGIDGDYLYRLQHLTERGEFVRTSLVDGHDESILDSPSWTGPAFPYGGRVYYTEEAHDGIEDLVPHAVVALDPDTGEKKTLFEGTSSDDIRSFVAGGNWLYVLTENPQVADSDARISAVSLSDGTISQITTLSADEVDPGGLSAGFEEEGFPGAPKMLVDDGVLHIFLIGMDADGSPLGCLRSFTPDGRQLTNIKNGIAAGETTADGQSPAGSPLSLGGILGDSDPEPTVTANLVNSMEWRGCSDLQFIRDGDWVYYRDSPRDPMIEFGYLSGDIRRCRSDGSDDQLVYSDPFNHIIDNMAILGNTLYLISRDIPIAEEPDGMLVAVDLSSDDFRITECGHGFFRLQVSGGRLYAEKTGQACLVSEDGLSATPVTDERGWGVIADGCMYISDMGYGGSGSVLRIPLSAGTGGDSLSFVPQAGDTGDGSEPHVMTSADGTTWYRSADRTELHAYQWETGEDTVAWKAPGGEEIDQMVPTKAGIVVSSHLWEGGQSVVRVRLVGTLGEDVLLDDYDAVGESVDGAGFRDTGRGDQAQALCLSVLGDRAYYVINAYRSAGVSYDPQEQYKCHIRTAMLDGSGAQDVIELHTDRD